LVQVQVVLMITHLLGHFLNQAGALVPLVVWMETNRKE